MKLIKVTLTMGLLSYNLHNLFFWISSLNSTTVCLQDHDDWTVGSNVDGITTRYYIDSNGYINLKIEGEMKKLPLFEQLVVIWEVCN